MYYAGIDFHKKYSVIVVVDSDGNLLQETRIARNEAQSFAWFFGHL